MKERKTKPTKTVVKTEEPSNKRVTIGNRNKDPKMQDNSQPLSNHIVTAPMAFTINIY